MLSFDENYLSPFALSANDMGIDFIGRYRNRYLLDHLPFLLRKWLYVYDEYPHRITPFTFQIN